MIKHLIFFLFFIAPSFSEAAYKDWSKKEQQLFKTQLTLQAIDTTLTWKMIECQKHTSCNLIERNPLLGNHPSKGDLLAQKVIGNIVLYHVFDKSEPYKRERRLRATNTIFTIVIVNNGIYYEKRF